jgi:hypothetical protein
MVLLPYLPASQGIAGFFSISSHSRHSFCDFPRGIGYRFHKRRVTMAYHRRRKMPSPFRCVVALYPAFIALLFFWFWDSVTGEICNLTPSSARLMNCGGPMPGELMWTLGAAICYGLFDFSYRVYRDFYRGDYYVDLTQHH